MASLAAGVETGRAQIVLDGKFGTSGPLNGVNYSIPAEVGAIRGNNLFHSFSQFNLAEKETASFSGPGNIQNILARVTGGSASSIDGTIRSEIPGANLFLINPNGITFGPHAAVDVTGSFAASSADYLKLTDGARFIASLDADDSALSTAPIAAFGFLDKHPPGQFAGVSAQQATIAVPDGKEISLVGGDVLLDGATVRAPGGRLIVSSTQAAGEVPVSPVATTFAALVAGSPKGGSIELRNNSHLDASGEGGGRVVIRGGKLTVDSSKIESNSLGTGAGQGIDIAIETSVNLSNGGQINSVSPPGLGAGGNIDLIAGSVRLDGGGVYDENFLPITQIAATTGDYKALQETTVGGGPARGGNISIHTSRLELINSAQISSASFGAGDAGNIEIEASSLFVDAQLATITQISSSTQQNEGGGKAGDIRIRSGSMDLVNAGFITADTRGSAPAGAIHINADSLTLVNGGTIAAPSYGPGLGGSIHIEANQLRIEGGEFMVAGVQAVTTFPDPNATGGSIQINANNVELHNSGSIFTSSYASGRGGDINLAAHSLLLDTASSIRASGEADGPAGNIFIKGSGPIVLQSGGSVSTSAPGSSGGNIELSTAGELKLYDSQITAAAGLNGGNISANSSSLIYLLHSTITGQADTTGTGFGNGGNLTFLSSLLVMNEGSLVSKSSFGNGGNISILSDYFFPSDSIVDASAPFGLPGTVQVTAPEVDLSGVLAVLPGSFMDAATLLRPDCGIRLGGNISSFIVMGRGGLPLTPGGFVPSPAPVEKDETK